MIKNFKKNSYRLSAAAIAVLTIAGAALLTGASAGEVKANDTKVIEDINTNNIKTVELSSNNNGIKVDNIDLPFVNDEEVIGKWETVDFIDTIDQFTPGEKQFKNKLFLKEAEFSEKGVMDETVLKEKDSDETMSVGGLTWTKGYVLYKNDKTVSKYTIKEINGTRYMFVEWKSGDYIYRGAEPSYYVLKEVK